MYTTPILVSETKVCALFHLVTNGSSVRSQALQLDWMPTGYHPVGKTHRRARCSTPALPSKSGRIVQSRRCRGTLSTPAFPSLPPLPPRQVVREIPQGAGGVNPYPLCGCRARR